MSSMSLQPTPERWPDYKTAARRLNARWDLGLPELLPIKRTIDLDNHQASLQRICARQIEALCSSKDFSLTRLLTDFDDNISATSSRWIPKPSQQKGTLSNMPISKSFVSRDVATKILTPMDAAAETPNKSRKELLALLERLLSDKRQLLERSDIYVNSRVESRLSETSQSDSRPDELSPKRQRSVDMMPPRSLTKKRKAEDASATKQSGKIKVKDESDTEQRTIHSYMIPATPLHTTSFALSTVPLNQISFDSTRSRSPPPSGVFTPPLQDVQISSNATSLTDDDDEVKQSQYDLSKQEFEEVCTDRTLRESLHVTAKSAGVQRFMAELTEHGPFRQPHKNEMITERLPFLYRYECHRFAQRASMPVQLFFKEIKRICKRDELTYDSFWAAAKAICANTKSFPTRLVAGDRSSTSSCNCAHGNFISSSGDKSVILSGVLSWADVAQTGMLTCKLNPLRMETSCRFDRRFGSDRLLHLELPYISTSNIPKTSSQPLISAKDLHVAVSKWISQETHFIAGRSWRAFFIEPMKKKTNGDKPKAFKVSMFAINGADFSPKESSAARLGGVQSDSRTPVTIGDFLNWHIPIAFNLNSKDLKTYQRLSLGLSRTCPTVVLEREEFLYLKDNPNWRNVMNDGCARMSSALADDISKMLGVSPTPSVFQGRISGAKGLWMVEYDDTLYPEEKKKRGYWIEITKDQLKIKPHPVDRNADPEHRTFEVLKWTGTPKVASMNLQLMGILSHGGVSRKQFEARLRGNTQGYLEDLLQAMKDPRETRLWVHQHENTASDKELEMLGAFPKDFTEQVNFLLEAGFSPKDNQVIVSRLRSRLKFYLEQYVDRLQIKLEMSTTVWCVPDPYGVLGENEVSLNFSRPWNGPNGRPMMSLHGLECLVYRAPGYLPTDVQRVNCVFKPELQHLLNVIVFPITGQIPLADKLSGGDYDGDSCWVCFDEEIVQSFKIDNKKIPAKPSERSLSLVNKAKPLTYHFSSGSPAPQEVDDFLFACSSFNLNTPMLGFCSNEHETLVYHRDAGIGDPGAMKLAALAGYLVDASKSGYFLSWNAWYNLKRSVSGAKELARPAYKKDSETKPRPVFSIFDYLKLIVAKQELTKVLYQFSIEWPEECNYDRTLSEPFKELEEKYKVQRGHQHADEIGLRILHQLKKDVDVIRHTYSPDLSTKGGEEFGNAMLAMHTHMQSIEPLTETHEISNRYANEKGREFSEWSRLRASCLYMRWHRSMGPFYAAGKDLAKIKADATGSTRTMVSVMRHIMRPDTKMVLRLAERAREATDDENEMQFGEWGHEDM